MSIESLREAIDHSPTCLGCCTSEMWLKRHGEREQKIIVCFQSMNIDPAEVDRRLCTKFSTHGYGGVCMEPQELLTCVEEILNKEN